jgi:NADH-quinone oxidoreductase subunit L
VASFFVMVVAAAEVVVGLAIIVSLLVDQLSILFVLLITGVGSLIHIYSIGYMAHDDPRGGFFAYLNLFVAAMLLLVLADNYLLLYVGWEGVGLASYLLISFWQHKPSAAAAGKKAFVVNRVGDFGLLMAIMLHVRHLRHGQLPGRLLAAPTASQPLWATLDRLFLLLGRLRQVGAGAAAVLAAGRDGGPDPGVGADPRGHDGDRRAST